MWRRIGENLDIKTITALNPERGKETGEGVQGRSDVTGRAASLSVGCNMLLRGVQNKQTGAGMIGHSNNASESWKSLPWKQIPPPAFTTKAGLQSYSEDDKRKASPNGSEFTNPPQQKVAGNPSNNTLS